LNHLLQVRNLQTSFFKREGTVNAVDGVTFHIEQGEALSLVGESGSGKTVTALSILKLIPFPGRIVSGEIVYQDRNILQIPEKAMNSIRGKEIGLILQDPASALNPFLSVGVQIAEGMRAHASMTRKEARHKTFQLMEKVQLPNVGQLYKSYPHQLSGGQKQRVLIAAALASSPPLLIADEPTTALDVSIQSQILSLLRELKNELHLSLMLITHDLSIVAELADRVIVFYAGKVIEQAQTEILFTHPVHPYTRALLNAIPRIDFGSKERHSKMIPLGGTVPDLMRLPEGCSFHPRCPLVKDICRMSFPETVVLSNRHEVACHRALEFSKS
jgi:oligopeptide/dipeptide ABC transporter ATP-binding protein